MYYSRFAVPLHLQNVIRMKDICCIGHVTKDKIVTPNSTVYMAGGTSFYFAYAINQLPKDVSFSLITAMDPTEKEPVEKMLKAGIDVTLNPSRNTVFFENIYGDNPNDRKQRVLAKADPFTIQQLEHVEAKPFSADFDEQLEAAEALYGIQLQFHFSLKEVQRELEQIAEGYPEGVRERVNQLLRQQIRKYAYLIKA